VRIFCGQGGNGSSDGRLHFLGLKTSDFSKFMVYPYSNGKGVFEAVRTEGGGQFFAILCGRF